MAGRGVISRNSFCLLRVHRNNVRRALPLNKHRHEALPLPESGRSWRHGVWRKSSPCVVRRDGMSGIFTEWPDFAARVPAGNYDRRINARAIRTAGIERVFRPARAAVIFILSSRTVTAGRVFGTLRSCDLALCPTSSRIIAVHRHRPVMISRFAPGDNQGTDKAPARR